MKVLICVTIALSVVFSGCNSAEQTTAAESVSEPAGPAPALAPEPASVPSEESPIEPYETGKARKAVSADLDTLGKDKQHTLYSIEPDYEIGQAHTGEKLFHYPVLGKMQLDEAEATTLVDLVRKGAEDSDGVVAACFQPRHALTGESGVKVVICFECYQMKVYPQGGGRPIYVPIVPAAKKTMNSLLRARNIRIAD